MRILQLNFERGWRGGERQTLLTLRYLRSAGHEVALLARADGELARRALAEKFTVYGYTGVAGAVAGLLRHGRRFDVLHAQTANMMTWLALLKPLLGGRLVFTRRTAFPLRGREVRTAWKWGRADVLVAISQAAAVEPRRLDLKVRVIPSAVASRPLDEARLREFACQFGVKQRLGLPPAEGLHCPDQPYVLATAAALTAEKDPCTLIRAVHALSQMRDDFIFVHLGAGGDAEPAARQLVQQLGLQHRYIFAGFQPAVEDLYRLMDVFVLSSRAEALGTSVLDAFLYKVAVVSTDAGGLSESLAEGRGLLCPVGDHAALADAMRLLLDDGALRARTVAKAYDYVLREHDVDVMGERYLQAYAVAASVTD